MSDGALSALRGRIFEIQRFSIHDGPGIRTTVFFKGCPLHCAWCHNPEAIRPEPQLSFVPRLCIGCGYCARTCPRQAHLVDETRGHVLDRARCVACGACTVECHARALEMVGREASVGEILDEVLRDRVFYETSGGGLTLSGGEPTMQNEFTAALLAAAKAAGLHCAIETCGFAAWGHFERLLPDVDCFFYDCKETDPERHLEYTGVSNQVILENLRRLHARGARIRLRCPIIPGFNDRPEHFAGIAALARELPRLEGIELMPYNRLGESKIERFGLDPARRPQALAPEREQINGWIIALRGAMDGCGVPVVNELN